MPFFTLLCIVSTLQRQSLADAESQAGMRDDANIVTIALLQNAEFADELRRKQYVTILRSCCQIELITRISNLTREYSVVSNCLAFAPLQTVSDEAQSIIDRKKIQLSRAEVGPSSGKHDVYNAQLHLMENSHTIECEFLSSITATGPDSTKAYIAVPTVLSHPWSRGTVVCSLYKSC